MKRNTLPFKQDMIIGARLFSMLFLVIIPGLGLVSLFFWLVYKYTQFLITMAFAYFAIHLFWKYFTEDD